MMAKKKMNNHSREESWRIVLSGGFVFVVDGEMNEHLPAKRTKMRVVKRPKT
jgi:hypothetical protein